MRPEPSGRALPPSEFRAQPDQRGGPGRAGALGWQREGVQNRAVAPPLFLLPKAAEPTGQRVQLRLSYTLARARDAPRL